MVGRAMRGVWDRVLFVVVVVAMTSETKVAASATAF